MKIVTLLLVALLLTPSLALAQEEGLLKVDPFPGMAGDREGNLVPAVRGIVNVFLTLVGIVAAIFIAIGGIRYISSGGDEKGQEKAKHQILYAVIGLIIIGLAAAIVNFTLTSFEGRGGGAGGGGAGGGAGGGGGGGIRDF